MNQKDNIEAEEIRTYSMVKAIKTQYKSALMECSSKNLHKI